MERRILMKKNVMIVLFSILLLFSIRMEVNAQGRTVNKQDAITWLNSQSGAYYDLDGNYGAQCSDFGTAYMNWLVSGDTRLNHPYTTKNGKDYGAYARSDSANWDVFNGGSGAQPGDLFTQAATNNNPYGHVGAIISVNGSTLTVIDQNTGGANGSAIIRTINASSVLNLIRYKHFQVEEPSGTTLPSGAGYTIPEGDYQIMSSLDYELFLDMPGDSFDSSENIKNAKYPSARVWHNLNNPYDVFTLKYDENSKCYIIYQKDSLQDMCLDVESCNMKRGSNVGFWPYVKGDGEFAQYGQQLWSLNPSGELGYYTIQSKLNGYYLDVQGSLTANGTNLILYDGTGNPNQKWAFVPYVSLEEKTVEDGDYRIVDASNEQKFVDCELQNVEGEDYYNAFVSLNEKGDGRIFTIKNLSNGAVCIYDSEGNRLDIQKGGSSNNVGVWPTEDGKEVNGRFQEWIIKPAEDAYYIQSRMYGGYLDLSNDNLIVKKWHTDTAKFKLIEVKSIDPLDGNKQNKESENPGSGTGNKSNDTPVNDQNQKAVIGSEVKDNGFSYKVKGNDTVVLTCGTDANAKKVEIPEVITNNGHQYRVTGIAENAFKGNRKVRNIILNNNIESIEGGAFYGCTNLRNITIPASVKKIGDKAFYKCKNLKTIKIRSKKIKSFGKKSFEKISKKVKVYMFKGKKNAYSKKMNRAGLPKTAQMNYFD